MLLATAPRALAESGGTLRTNAAPNQGGLRVEVDDRWISGMGYQPVRITISPFPAGANPFERRLTVRLTPVSSLDSAQRIVVSQEVVLAAGAASVEATLLVPQAIPSSSLIVHVEEFGERIDALTATLLTLRGADASEAFPSMLFVHEGVPPLKDRDSLFANYRRSRRLSDETLPRASAVLDLTNIGQDASSIDPHLTLQCLLVESLPRAMLLSPEEVPESWLALSSADIIYCSWTALQTLAERHPSRFEALRTWCECGGNLVLFGDRLDAERAKVDQLLRGGESTERWRLLPLAPEHARAFQDEALRMQGVGAAQVFYSQPGGGFNPNSPPTNPQEPGAAPAESGDAASVVPEWRWGGAPPRSGERALWLGELGLGQVALVPFDDIGGCTPIYRQCLLGALEVDRWRPSVRLGRSTLRDNTDWGRHAIPGVGEPPLFSFMAAITLFVVVLGPVNYLLLRRAQRLFLLFVTVPAGAAVVTLGLFAYALIADGLGVRVKVRSYTELDQRHGRMVNWSRQTYYAGLRPRGGLEFSGDTSVHKIERWGVLQQEPPRAAPRLTWRPSPSSDHRPARQALESGFVPPRTITQFATIRSGPTKASLEVDPSGPVRVVNHLGVRIRTLVVWDEQGLPHFGGEIEDGASATLGAKPAGVDPFRVALVASDPVANSGGRALRRPYSRSRSYRYYQFLDELPDKNLAPVAWSTNRSEQELEQALLSIATSRGYLALVERCPFDDLGVPRPRIDPSSVAIVRGYW